MTRSSVAAAAAVGFAAVEPHRPPTFAALDKALTSHVTLDGEAFLRLRGLTDRVDPSLPALTRGRFWAALASVGEIPARRESLDAALLAIDLSATTGDDQLHYRALVLAIAIGARRRSGLDDIESLLARAQALAGSAIAGSDDGAGTANALETLMFALVAQARLAEAISIGRQAQAAMQLMGDDFKLLEVLAFVAAKQGRLDDAACVAGHVDALGTEHDLVPWPFGARCRAELDEGLARMPSAERIRVMEAGAASQARQVFAHAFGDVAVKVTEPTPADRSPATRHDDPPDQEAGPSAHRPAQPPTPPRVECEAGNPP